MGATNNIIFNENRRTVISWLFISYSLKANARYDTEHWYLILSSIKIKISWPIWKFWAFLENRFSIDFFSNQISTPSCYLNVNQTINLFNFGTNFPIENFWMRRKHFHIFTFYFKNYGNWIENYGKTFAYLRRILCKHFPVFPSLVNIDISTESVHNQRCDFDWLNS